MSTSQLVYSSVYTGYLDVDQGAKHLFFTFYESRRDPATGMWLFWMRDHLTLLDFLLDEAREGKPLIRTMVFFNTRNCARLACQYIKRKLAVDSPYRSQIFAIWATKSAIAKRKIMDRFSTGKIIILFATEVAGMVSTYSLL